MKVVGVVGTGADEFARRLVDELGERGPVARVRGGGTTPDGGALVTGASADTNCVLEESETRVSGPPRTLSSLLDDLAPNHDYAVVTGRADARLPHLVVGDAEYDGEVLARIDRGDGPVEDVLESIEATEPRETVASLIARAKRAPEAARSGAIATFTGRVRARDDPDDPETTHLEFETYEGVAEDRMATIAEELEARDGVFRVLMHHKTGVVEAGEDIVFVVVLAGHRAEAFATVSDGIDRLKAEVPIFKKEVTLDGEFWAHEQN